jgi:hypothetical protein
VFNLTSLLVAFMGAVVLLAIVKVMRRVTARSPLTEASTDTATNDRGNS